MTFQTAYHAWHDDLWRNFEPQCSALEAVMADDFGRECPYAPELFLGRLKDGWQELTPGAIVERTAAAIYTKRLDRERLNAMLRRLSGYICAVYGDACGWTVVLPLGEGARGAREYMGVCRAAIAMLGAPCEEPTPADYAMPVDRPVALTREERLAGLPEIHLNAGKPGLRLWSPIPAAAIGAVEPAPPQPAVALDTRAANVPLPAAATWDDVLAAYTATFKSLDSLDRNTLQRLSSAHTPKAVIAAIKGTPPGTANAIRRIKEVLRT